MAVVLATARFANISGLPQDIVQNDFVFQDATLAAAVAVAQSAVPDFYTGVTGGGHKVQEFLSQTLSRATNAVTLDCYDITSHLDGSPHGSPVATTNFTIAAPVSAVDIPSEVAVCLSYAADLTGLAEVGATDTSIPTPEAAQDMGAPATHTGKDRPKARRRGRLYIGPLSFGAVNTSGGAQALVATNLINALHDAGARLLGLTGANWAVWSRRSAAVYTVNHGWIDNEFDTTRRRRIKASARTTF